MAKVPEEVKVFHITDMDRWQFVDVKPKPLLVSIRGCNGSGKSSVVMAMMGDPNMYVLSWFYKGKVRYFATVFPSYNTAVMGTYFNKTGGMDTYSDNAMIRQGLEILWNCPYTIIMEGAVASTIFSTYGDLYKSLESKEGMRPREIVFAVITTPVEVCLERIQLRNGGKPVNSERISSHWRSIKKNVHYWEDYGYTCLELDNTAVKMEDTLDWFNEELYQVIGKRAMV